MLDVAGRRRSPATVPGYHAGRPPRNKGMRYPADPPTVEEIVAVMRDAADDRHGWRVRAMIVVLWPAGLRIQDALALGEHDLDQGIDPEKITTAVRTRRPPLPGPLPATGAEMRESAVVIYRIADDRIAEHSFDQG